MSSPFLHRKSCARSLQYRTRRRQCVYPAGALMASYADARLSQYARRSITYAGRCRFFTSPSDRTAARRARSF